MCCRYACLYLFTAVLFSCTTRYYFCLHYASHTFTCLFFCLRQHGTLRAVYVRRGVATMRTGARWRLARDIGAAAAFGATPVFCASGGLSQVYHRHLDGWFGRVAA